MTDTPESVPAVAGIGHNQPPIPTPTSIDPESYWHALIDTPEAAKFLGMKVTTLHAWRHRGGGPQYVVISARCIRYRRYSLRDFADARVRSNTSDTGAEAV